MATTTTSVAQALSPAELAAWRGFMRAHATLVRQLDCELEEAHGLPLVSYDVLARLEKAPDRRMRMRELADAVRLSRSGLTRLIDRLQQRGLIERRRDAEDRRKVLATITDEGRRLVSAIPFLEGTPIRTAIDRMTVAERERIAAAMREFNAAVMTAEEESLLVETEA